jgi:hypothetical protein
MNHLAPEEAELNKKVALLERLTDRLADKEEQMADLRAALDRFETRYTMEVGRLYAEFDDIEALIAEEEYKLVPDDEEIKRKAEELRRKAEESAARADEAADCSFKLNPTPEARKAYHTLARAIHPDLAIDVQEKERRHVLMAELNQAYSMGDQSKLDRLVDDLRNSPDLITGDTVGHKLVRTIRQISQVKQRLAELKLQFIDAEVSELFTLMVKADEESADGRDMLKQIAARTRTQISKSQRRLANLRNVNAAAEEYVREKYGMDISSFRQ